MISLIIPTKITQICVVQNPTCDVEKNKLKLFQCLFRICK